MGPWWGGRGGHSAARGPAGPWALILGVSSADRGAMALLCRERYAPDALWLCQWLPLLSTGFHPLEPSVSTPRAHTVLSSPPQRPAPRVSSEAGLGQ